ncbi:MAG: hypothetical protein WC140_06880 [Bacteroidales bacterium]
MKALKLVMVLSICISILSGCDFFRKIAGKPTSKDIERMKVEAKTKAKKQRQLDSLNKIQADMALEDSLAIVKSSYDKRFYVILGSYKVKGNNEKMAKMLEINGYESPVMFKFKNGFEVVSAAGFDSMKDAMKCKEEVKEFGFCPEDIWIYDVNKNLHE